jgi:deoxyribodipyrimidine photo-lyase
MSKPFKIPYSQIPWPNTPESESHFKAWTAGHTGYPIVDAAMRQLAATKYMHNRTRMVVASFLTKDLLIDWRRGEHFFMRHLVDGDFASNNGGWGWSAGTGVDPQPYFRIFNPLLQSEKFDQSGTYIRTWVPELRGVQGNAVHAPHARLNKGVFEKLGYPQPIVDHAVARKRSIEVYKRSIVVKNPA